MELFDKEHHELLQQFEKDFYFLRLDREKDKNLWKNYVYESGETNNLFKAYRLGYSLGKAVEMRNN